jgi:hypothetical protein
MDDKKEVEVLAKCVELLYEHVVNMDVLESSDDKSVLISRKISSYNRRLAILEENETVRILKLKLAGTEKRYLAMLPAPNDEAKPVAVNSCVDPTNSERVQPPQRRNIFENFRFPYTGGRDSPPIDIFLERVNDFIKMNGLREDEVWAQAIGLFEGQARVWFKDALSRAANWNQLCALAITELQPSGHDFRLTNVIRNRRQASDEPVTYYIANMRHLNGRLAKPFDEGTLLEIIRYNLNPAMSRGLALHDIRSVDQLRDLGRTLENVEIDISSKFEGRDRVGRRDPTGLKCFKCNEPGHLARACKGRDLN